MTTTTATSSDKLTSHDESLVDSKMLEKAEMVGVFDSDGNERPFGGLVRHGKVCVVFIRHFLCGYCQEYLVALQQLLLREDGDSILDKNKKMVVIGCGHWSVIKSYKDLLGEGDCPFEIYAESTSALVDSLGMLCKFDVGDTKTQGHYITQSLTSTIISSLFNGCKMGPTSFLRSGKMSQQGGEFIFVDGHCVFAHRMKTARDHLEPQELLDRFISLV